MPLTKIKGSIAPNVDKSPINVSALKALTDLNDLVTVETQGYYTAGDGGHGTYRYSLGSVAAANNGSVIQPDSGTGRWLLTSSTINARQFGAKGDGVADDAAALQLAFNASGAKDVYFPAGTYKCTSQVTAPATIKSITGESRGSTIIQGSGGAISGAVLSWAGAGFTATTALAANAVAGTQTLTFASSMAGVVAAGDIICIFNSTNSSYSTARTYYYAGEYCEVYSVNAAVVTVVEPLAASYAFGSVAITKLSSFSGTLSNISVRGDGSTSDNYSAFKARYADGLTITDCLFENAHYAGCNIEQCYDVKITNSVANCVIDSATVSGLQYGVIVANSQKLLIAGVSGISERHVISVGGSSSTGATDPRIANRDLIVSNCNLQGKDFAGLDCHGNCENYKFIGNIVNGMDVGGNNFEVIGNKINSYELHGITGSELLGSDFLIANNTITVNAASNVSPIYILLTGTVYALDGISRITNNKIVFNQLAGYTGSIIGISFQKSASNAVAASAEIIDNSFTTGSVVNAYSIYIYGGGLVGSNLSCFIRGNKIVNGRIFCDYVLSADVSENYINGGGGSASQHGLTVINRTGSPITRVCNNFVTNHGASCIRLTSIAPTASNYVICRDNTCALSSAVTASSKEFDLIPVATSKIEYTGNTIIEAGATSLLEAITTGVCARLESAGTSTIASAAALPLGTAPYSVFTVSGVTTITSITTSMTRPTGFVLKLIFSGVLTFTDGGNLKLAGNFVTTADDTITLMFDGTNWTEIARSVN